MRNLSHPKVQYWATMSGALWWVAALFGVACLIDTMHQSFSYGAWLPFKPLYFLYYPVLTAYAGSREREKWVRGAKQYEQRTGEFFVYAWVGLALFIFADNSMGFAAAWPPTLTQTLTVVLGVFLGVKFVGGFRPGLDPDPIPGPGPSPLPNPNPTPGPTPTPDPDPDPEPDPAPNPAPGGDSTGDTLIAAYQALGEFSAEDVAQKTGFSMAVVTGHLGQMVRYGRVQKIGKDRFRWIGQA